MATIGTIENTEPLSSVRTKLNAAIAEANKVDGVKLTADSALQPGANISELTNDAGFVPSGSNISVFVNDPGYLVPGSNISELVNDAAYLVDSDLDVVVFDNVAAAKAATNADGKTIFTKGYYTENDGGQAKYIVQTAVEFGGTPDEFGDHTDAGGNVLVLQESGRANVRQYGAKGDGVADDINPIMAAIAKSLSVFIPAGTYKITSPINISQRDQFVFGDGLKSIISQATDNTDAIVLVDGVSAGVKIARMLITGSAAFATGGIGVRSEYAGDLRLFDVTVTNLWKGFYIDTRTFVTSADVWLLQCKTFDTQSHGFHLNNGTQIYLNKCDALSSGGSGFHINAGSAYHLIDCLSLSSAAQGLQILGGVDWVWLNQVECDNSGIDGMRFSDARGVFMTATWAGTSGGEGYSFLSGNSDFYLANCTARSNDNHGYTVIGMIGAFFVNCSAFENNADTLTDRAGFSIQTGASKIVLNNCDATSPTTNRQKYGIEVIGSSDDVKILGGRAEGNGLQQVRVTSSGDVRIKDVIGYVTENTGSAVSTNAAPNAAVTHGLSITPDNIDITPLNDYSGNRYWVSSIGSTTFTITTNTAPAADVNFHWRASSKK